MQVILIFLPVLSRYQWHQWLFRFYDNGHNCPLGYYRSGLIHFWRRLSYFPFVAEITEGVFSGGSSTSPVSSPPPPPLWRRWGVTYEREKGWVATKKSQPSRHLVPTHWRASLCCQAPQARILWGHSTDTMSWAHPGPPTKRQLYV